MSDARDEPIDRPTGGEDAGAVGDGGAAVPPPGPISEGGAGRAARRRGAQEPAGADASAAPDPIAEPGEAAMPTSELSGGTGDVPPAAAGETGDEPPVDEGKRGKKKKKKKSRGFLIETGLVLVIALVVAVVMQAFFVRIYLIPSQSMEPTLHGCPGCTGDRIAVDKITYRFTDPAPGDVVVFHGPESWDAGFVSNRSDNVIVRGFQEIGSFVGLVAPDQNDMVKRIIATGGQTVQCLEGDPGIMVDGQVLDEPYLAEPAATSPWANSACQGEFFGPITVPEGHYWMMGDNRTDSADSRYHRGDELQGTVPRENIIGKARWKVLPVSRMGSISDHDPQD